MGDADRIKQSNLIDYRNKHLRFALRELELAEKADAEAAAFDEEKDKYLEASGRIFKTIREQIGTWL